MKRDGEAICQDIRQLQTELEQIESVIDEVENQVATVLCLKCLSILGRLQLLKLELQSIDNSEENYDEGR